MSRRSRNLSSAAVDAFSGDLYIADSGDNSVTVIAGGTDIITIIAGGDSSGSGTYGSGGYSGDGGLAVLATLNAPTGLTVDAVRGLLYIADRGNNVIRMIAKSTGIITTIAGLGAAGYGGDGGQATSALISQPAGTAVDPITGNLYIADSGNNMIRMVSKSTGVITAVAGSSVDLGGYTGDGGLAAKALFNNPTGLAFSPTDGNLYIADTGNNIIRMLTKGTGIISTVAGNGHQRCSKGGKLAVSTCLHMPIGLAFDAVKGQLFIADSGNNAIRMVDSAGIITTVVGDDLRHGGPAIYASLYRPRSIALDVSSSMIHIVDSDLNSARDSAEIPATAISPPTMAPTGTGKVK